MSGFFCRLVPAAVTTPAPNAAHRWLLSTHADDEDNTQGLIPWMLTGLDVAEETVETANGGVIEAHHRANVLVRDLEDLTTALEGDGGPVGEMAYWAGRVARLERDAALVAEAVRRVGEWHDVLSGQVGVVEGRILEAGGVYSDHLGQLRTDLAMGHAPEEAESAMRLEAQAARAEARVRGREAAME